MILAPPLRVKAAETRLIPAGFYPSLETGLLWNDNVFRRENDEETDLLYIARPTLHWKAGTPRYDLNLNYQGNYGVYRTLNEQDYMDHAMSAGIGFQPTDKLGLEISDQYKIGHDQPGAAGTQIFSPRKPNRWHRNHFRAHLTYGRLIATAQLQLTFEETGWRYQNNRREFSDRNLHTGTAAWLYHIRPKTWLVTEFQYQIVDYQSNNPVDLDSDKWYLFQGVKWEPSPITRGQILVGYIRNIPNEKRLFREFSGIGAQASIDWRPIPYSRGTLAVERMPATGSIATSFYLASRVRLNWRHKFTELLTVQTNAAYEKDDYSFNKFGPTRKDHLLHFGLRLEYKFRPWLSMGLQYNYDFRDSSLKFSDYTNNTVGFHVQILPEYARSL